MSPVGRIRALVRWVPAATLGVALSVLWPVFLSGSGYSAVIAWIALISVGQLLAPLALLALLAWGVWKRRFSRPMQATLALSLIALWPAMWGFGVLPITFPYDLETSTPTATVRLPSDETLRVAWGGDHVTTNYHAFTPDQRWAYDLLVEPAGHGSSDLESYGCYGTPVVAPVAASVRSARDGFRDEVPGKPSRVIDEPAGNSVVLEMETGTFLLLAHFKKGSVAVRTGDSVEEGQMLGECGNSGNTSEPHIHVHHQRQDPSAYPINMAEGLPLFFRDHDGDPMPEGGLTVREGQVEFTGAVVRHVPARPGEGRE